MSRDRLYPGPGVKEENQHQTGNTDGNNWQADAFHGRVLQINIVIIYPLCQFIKFYRFNILLLRFFNGQNMWNMSKLFYICSVNSDNL